MESSRMRFISCIAFAAITAMMTGISQAKADVAVTYTVNVTGMPQMQARPGFTPPKFPMTVKAWYTGSKARVEQVGGNVTIYDMAAGEEYHLNPAAKTYYVQDTGGGERGGRGGRGGLGGGSTATLTPTSETKTIGDNSSVRYALNGTLSFGRRPGGFGGGDGGTPPPSPTISGDVWFSSAVPLPNSATTATPEAAILSMGMRPLARPLADAVLKIKEVPLAGKVNLTMVRPSFDGGDPTTISITETFSTVEVRTGAVSSDLFTPPASYTKVDPPQRGGWGGGGGRRGGFGGGGGRGGWGGGQGGGGGFGGQDGGQGGDGAPPPGGAPDDGGAPPPDNGGGGDQ